MYASATGLSGSEAVCSMHVLHTPDVMLLKSMLVVATCAWHQTLCSMLVSCCCCFNRLELCQQCIHQSARVHLLQSELYVLYVHSLSSCLWLPDTFTCASTPGSPMNHIWLPALEPDLND